MLRKNKFFLLLSFLITAFGQPAFASWLCPLTALCGYALFWVASLSLDSSKKRFFLATSWFAAVQLVQLSWMTSIEFQGVYILFVYGALTLFLGAQFGLLTHLVTKELSWLRMAALSSLWLLFEWSRLFVLCGLSFNPAGLALAFSPYSMQMASLGGIFGLSFFVIFVNLLCLKWLLLPKRKAALCLLLFALLPYFFSLASLQLQPDQAQEMEVALVQTDLLPSQKIPLPGRFAQFIPPEIQWEKIAGDLEKTAKKRFDLILLPEAVVPFGFDASISSLERAKEILGPAAESTPLIYPFAEKDARGSWKVSNAFFAQTLANHYQSELVAGLDQVDRADDKIYNAAFHFKPNEISITRSEKRILLPLAEMLPFEWLRPLVKSYGIAEFFSPGKEAKLFFGKTLLFPSICYEETFPHFMREGRGKGAQLFVNMTNDNWYPSSRLGRQHFSLARLRCVENGAPLVRACNSGQTAVIDSCGHILGHLPEGQKGVLNLKFSLYSRQTLYTLFGDLMPISASFLILIIFLYQTRVRKILAQNVSLS
jgi:apolipoprotein N-acyltransferase